MSAVLLDTCAAIWFGNGDHLTADALSHVEAAANAHSLYVSPITAWEIGLIATSRPDPIFDFHPQAWFRRFLTGPGIRLIELLPEVAIAASFLPGQFHKDPADRLIVATAIKFKLPLVTRDARIIEYGAAGHVSVIPC